MKKPTDMEIEQAVRIEEVVHCARRQRNIQQAWGEFHADDKEWWLSAARAANRVCDRWEKRAKR